MFPTAYQSILEACRSSNLSVKIDLVDGPTFSQVKHGQLIGSRLVEFVELTDSNFVDITLLGRIDQLKTDDFQTVIESITSEFGKVAQPKLEIVTEAAQLNREWISIFNDLSIGVRVITALDLGTTIKVESIERVRERSAERAGRDLCLNLLNAPGIALKVSEPVSINGVENIFADHALIEVQFDDAFLSRNLPRKYSEFLIDLSKKLTQLDENYCIVFARDLVKSLRGQNCFLGRDLDISISPDAKIHPNQTSFKVEGGGEHSDLNKHGILDIIGSQRSREQLIARQKSSQHCPWWPIHGSRIDTQPDLIDGNVCCGPLAEYFDYISGHLISKGVLLEEVISPIQF